jgi:hypothetical protein
VFQEPVSGLLSNFSADWVLCLLGFLEKFGNFFERWIRFLLFSFRILDVLQEQPVSLIINLLRTSLRIGINIFLQGTKPINFLF